MKCKTHGKQGAYKLACPDCNKAYVGQTSRRFSIRYNKHRRAFHNNSQSSSFAQHFTHSFGLINNIMQILHHQKKGTHLNTIERFYIHKEHAACNHLIDEQSIFPNKIFDTLIKPIQPLPPRSPKSSPHLNFPPSRTTNCLYWNIALYHNSVFPHSNSRRGNTTH